MFIMNTTYNRKAAYVPFGSFQHPGTGTHQEIMLGCPNSPRVVSPPAPSNNNFARLAKPLSACPGFPTNGEMKYINWKNVSRCSSSTNISQMTHHNHNPALVKDEKEVQDENRETTNHVDNEELHAALTLSSCFNKGS